MWFNQGLINIQSTWFIFWWMSYISQPNKDRLVLRYWDLDDSCSTTHARIILRASHGRVSWSDAIWAHDALQTVYLVGLNLLLMSEKNNKLFDRSRFMSLSSINVPSSFNFSIKETQIDRPEKGRRKNPNAQWEWGTIFQHKNSKAW